MDDAGVPTLIDAIRPPPWVESVPAFKLLAELLVAHDERGVTCRENALTFDEMGMTYRENTLTFDEMATTFDEIGLT